MPPRPFPLPLSIGTDICSIPRILSLLTRKPANAKPFVKRLLSKQEIEALPRERDPVRLLFRYWGRVGEVRALEGRWREVRGEGSDGREIDSSWIEEVEERWRKRGIGMQRSSPVLDALEEQIAKEIPSLKERRKQEEKEKREQKLKQEKKEKEKEEEENNDNNDMSDGIGRNETLIPILDAWEKAIAKENLMHADTQRQREKIKAENESKGKGRIEIETPPSEVISRKQKATEIQAETVQPPEYLALSSLPKGMTRTARQFLRAFRELRGQKPLPPDAVQIVAEDKAASENKGTSENTSAEVAMTAHKAGQLGVTSSSQGGAKTKGGSDAGPKSRASEEEIAEILRRKAQLFQDIDILIPQISRAAQWLAGRFAAKEAAIKAYRSRRLTFHDIRILTPTGEGRSVAPEAHIISETRGWADAQIVPVNISHDEEYATAVCLSCEEPKIPIRKTLSPRPLVRHLETEAPKVRNVISDFTTTIEGPPVVKLVAVPAASEVVGLENGNIISDERLDLKDENRPLVNRVPSRKPLKDIEIDAKGNPNPSQPTHKLTIQKLKAYESERVRFASEFQRSYEPLRFIEAQLSRNEDMEEDPNFKPRESMKEEEQITLQKDLSAIRDLEEEILKTRDKLSLIKKTSRIKLVKAHIQRLEDEFISRLGKAFSVDRSDDILTSKADKSVAIERAGSKPNPANSSTTKSETKTLEEDKNATLLSQQDDTPYQDPNPISTAQISDKAKKATSSSQKSARTETETAAGKSLRAKRTIFIGNLPFSTTIEDLENHFSPYCPTPKAYLYTSSSNEPLGTGAVVLSSVEEASTARSELDNTEFLGRKIRCMPWLTMSYRKSLQRVVKRDAVYLAPYRNLDLPPWLQAKAQDLYQARDRVVEVQGDGYEEDLLEQRRGVEEGEKGSLEPCAIFQPPLPQPSSPQHILVQELFRIQSEYQQRRGRGVVVTNIGGDISEADLKGLFKEDLYGKVEIKIKNGGESAYIIFANAELAEKAREENDGVVAFGRSIGVERVGGGKHDELWEKEGGSERKDVGNEREVEEEEEDRKEKKEKEKEKEKKKNYQPQWMLGRRGIKKVKK